MNNHLQVKTWTAPAFQGFQPPFTEDNTLDALRYLDIAPYQKPETVLVRDGWVYASCESGILIRLREDGSGLEKLLETGTTIVGFDFDRQGNIIYCDGAYDEAGGAICKLVLDGKGRPEPVVVETDGEHLAYPDAVAVDGNGIIYFTEACCYSPAKYRKDKMHAFNVDMMTHSKTGRVYRFDPAVGKAELVADGLCFANGISVTQDNRYVLVAETLEYNVWKIDVSLRGAHVGDAGTTALLTNLPGFPDNLTAVGNGTYWIGFSGDRSSFIDDQASTTDIRSQILGAPFEKMDELLAGAPKPHVFCMDESGKVLKHLHAQKSEYILSTGLTETDDRYYIHSVNPMGKIAWLPKRP